MQRRTPVLLLLAASVAVGGCGLDRLFSSSKGKGHGKDPAAAEERRRRRAEHKKRRGLDRPDQRAPAAPTGAAPLPPGGASAHLAMGTPKGTGASDDLLLIKPEYALAYSKSRHVASWVSWNLDASHFGSAPRMQGKFLTDETLPAGVYRATHEDYVGSGYDRGHMVRSEERTRTAEENRATFLLTNVLPQRHELNAGPWLRLEEYCQKLAQRDGRELYVVAGGVFPAGKAPATIGHGVAVPESFFKIVVVLARGAGAADVKESTRVITVVMPNTTSPGDPGWGAHRTTVNDVERRTGYDFLSALPEPVQRSVQARIDTGPTD